MRTLAFSCYDIRFSRPSKTTIAQRLLNIATAEGLSTEPNALELLAESCGNDMRCVLNQLQVMSTACEYQNDGITFMDMKERLLTSAKDRAAMLTPFEACKNLLTSSVAKRMSIQERMDNFFVDHNLVHLLVQENILNSVAKRPPEVELLTGCARSAEFIALGDIVSQRIREHQEWNLLPDMGLLSAVYPAYETNGFLGFPEFPKFLGNYSRISRAKRLCLELHALLRVSTAVGRTQLVRSNYLDVLRGRILQPLLREDTDAAVSMLDAYGLQREHVTEHLDELGKHLTGSEEGGYKLVDPKVKAAMTRELNTGSHAVRVVLPKSKKRKAAAPDADDLGDEADLDDCNMRSEEMQDEKDGIAVEVEEVDAGGGALLKTKAKSKAKAKAKPKAKEVEHAEETQRPKAKAASTTKETQRPKAKAAAAKVSATAKAAAKKRAKK